MNVSEAYLQLCRQNYRAYVYHVHHGLWKPGRAISFVCDKVQEFVERKTDAPYEILVISLPPQHGKSMAITETLPSWALGRHPLWRVIEISYSDICGCELLTEDFEAPADDEPSPWDALDKLKLDK